LYKDTGKVVLLPNSFCKVSRIESFVGCVERHFKKKVNQSIYFLFVTMKIRHYHYFSEIVLLVIGVCVITVPSGAWAFWNNPKTNTDETAEREQFAQDLSKTSSGQESGEVPVEYGVDVVRTTTQKQQKLSS
jgi:hypothetical protein